MTTLLEADNVTFAYRGGAPVLHDVSLSLQAGESVGLVGESGAGKSTILRLLLGLDAPTSGEVRFAGSALRVGDRGGMREFRRAVQPVFQDPFASLDPRMTVGSSIAEPLRALGRRGDDGTYVRLDAATQREIVAELLRAVDLPEDSALRYPEAFSGGQRQRIAIARALAPNPQVILADEPVSALDTSVRMTVIRLFQQLAAERGIGMLLVSHDLTIVSALCERMIVLQNGRIVEQGLTQTLLRAPEHPYTQQLLAAVPRL